MLWVSFFQFSIILIIYCVFYEHCRFRIDKLGFVRKGGASCVYLNEPIKLNILHTLLARFNSMRKNRSAHRIGKKNSIISTGRRSIILFHFLSFWFLFFFVVVVLFGYYCCCCCCSFLQPFRKRKYTLYTTFKSRHIIRLFVSTHR